MEILQTIWVALTSENTNLIKIITFPMLVLELTISVLLFTTILNIQSNKKQKILYILILSLIGFLNLIIVPAPYNSFINLIACPICVYFIFKTNVLKAFLAEIIPFISFIIVGAIVGNLYKAIIKISNQVFNTTPIHKIIGSFLIFLDKINLLFFSFLTSLL